MHDLSRGTIVVTGAAGLIGSAVVWALNRRNVNYVLAVDRLDTSEKWKHLVPLRFNDYVDADEFLERIVRDPGAFGSIGTVFHLGACSATTERDSDYLMTNNYEYTKSLARWATSAGARFVYASSAATYGALESDLDDAADMRTLRPLNMYAYSKLLFDLYAQRTGLDSSIVGLKYFNVFGPNEDHKGDMRSIVNKAFAQIGETGIVRLFKSYRPEFPDGGQRRDFIYVKDAVDMTLHVAEAGTAGLVNIGAGKAQTWLDLVRPIFRSMGREERIEFVEMPEQLRDKYQYSTCARIDRLRGSGYDKPITPLADAVADYVERYLIPGRVLEPSDKQIAAHATSAN